MPPVECILEETDDDIMMMMMMMPRTLDLLIVALGLPHQQGRCLSVQGIGRVRVAEQLGEEDLEDVDHVEHG